MNVRTRVGSRVAKLAAVAAVAVAVPVVGGAVTGAAEAACIRASDYPNPIFTSKSPGSSDPFNASIGCNGVWALRSTYDVVRVKGQFNDGTWTDSALSAKWVTTTKSAIDAKSQIVGQTVDGRRLRGYVVEGFADYVRYRY